MKHNSHLTNKMKKQITDNQQQHNTNNRHLTITHNT